MHHRGEGREDEAAGAGLRQEPAEERKVLVGRLELNVIGLIWLKVGNNSFYYNF